jgi:hypothetical protein
MTSFCGDSPVLSLLHRHVWQRLPQRPRRTVLLHGAALAAPRPSPDADPALPLIVVGNFGSASGLGESARLCYDALTAAGLPVFGIDLTSVLMQPGDHRARDPHPSRQCAARPARPARHRPPLLGNQACGGLLVLGAAAHSRGLAPRDCVCA